MRAFLVAIVAVILPWQTARAQSNDRFAGRLALSGASATAISNNRAATHEPGEPNHAASYGTRSLWWTWTAPASGSVSVSTFPGGVTTALDRLPSQVLAVYTGGAVDALTEVASSNRSSSDSGIYYSSYTPSPLGTSVSFQATAGTVYQIAVDVGSSFVSGDDGTVVLCVNQAPTIQSVAGVSARVGTTFSFSVLATGEPTEFGATDLPPGLAINPTSGSITGTPSVAGTYPARLTATNPGGTGSGTLTITVAEASAPVVASTPVIASAAATGGTVGSPFSYYLSVSGGSGTRFSADSLPAGLALDASTGQVAGTPSIAGNFDVAVSASNATGTAQAVVRFAIVAAPVRPIITSGLTASATVGQSSFYYTVSTQDTSGPGKPTGFAASNLPPGLGFNPVSGEFGGVPTTAGTYVVPISATNAGGTSSAVVTITVAPASPAVSPQTAAPPQLTSLAVANVTLGNAFSYQLVATNAPTVFGAANLPVGVSLNAASGYLSGTPAATGVFLVPVTARNAYGTATGTLTINVAATAATTTAAVSTITSPAAAAGVVGQSFSYQLQASSSSSGYYYSSGSTYGAVGLPPGLTLDAAYGTISGKPTTAGTYPATVFYTVPPSPYLDPPPPSVTGTAVVTFVVAASAPAVSPVVPTFTSAGSTAGVVGKSFGYTISATGSPTGYAAAGLPPGLSLGTSGGAISGTPTAAGNYPVSISATNAAGTTNATITIAIAAAVPPPVFTRAITDTGTVGTSFSTSLSADNSPSGYSAANLPPGLSLDAVSGRISGTPTAAGQFAVPISATNDSGITQATLTITIVSGVPSTPAFSNLLTVNGTVGGIFSFSISASPTPAAYGATNLPPGLTLNTATGLISGTPTAAGIYSAPLTAANVSGTGTATLTINVAATPPLPVFSGLGVAEGKVGSTFGYTLAASNSPTSFAADNLPGGLSLNPTSGQITGAPTTAGNFAVGVSATNAGGTASATLTLFIAASSVTPAPPVLTSAAGVTGSVNVPLRHVLTASNSPGQFGLGSTTPPGLAFDPATGTLAGTPTVAGTYALPVSATNSGGTGAATLTVLITTQGAIAPVISSPACINAYVGETFYYFITADNNPTSFDLGASLPAGWSFDPASGRLSGTPTATGTTTLPVSASNAAGTGRATVSVVVTSISSQSLPLRITSPAAARATAGAAFNYQITGTGLASYYYGYTATGLPSGLSVNQNTGKISGTTSATGTYTVALSAANSNLYQTVRATLRLVVAAGSSSVPVISSAAGASGIVGEPLYYYLTADNNPASYGAASLPPGLSFDAAASLISGVPTTAGAFTATATATNGAGQGSATVAFNIVSAVYAPPRITSRAAGNALLGSLFEAMVTVTSSTGSFNNFAASGLPPGLTINSQTGSISGTPALAGTFPITLSVNASYLFSTNTARYLLVVETAPRFAPTISSPAAVAGAVGAPLRYRLTGTDGGRDFTAADLPGGLQFDPGSGTIAGIPTTAGTFRVPVTATNSAGTGSATLTVAITDAPTPPTLAGNSLAISTQVRTTGFVYQIKAANNPASYSAVGLPPGLSVDALSGAISGATTVAGSYPVTITATNAGGSTSAVVRFTFTAGPALPIIAGSATVFGYVGDSFSNYALSAYNGTLTYAAGGALPPGLYLNSSSGQFYGVPTTAGTYSVPVSATNASGTTTATLTFLIAATGSAPVFSSGNVAAGGTVGASFSYYFYGSNGSVRYGSSTLPPGLSLDTVYGQIRGTPTAAGIYPVTLKAINLSGQSSAVVTITIANPPAPTITSAAGAAATVGTAFRYGITTAVGGPFTFSASGLPAGLSVDSFTGVILGIPTNSGSYPITLSAANSVGAASATITLNVGNPVASSGAPLITSPAGINYTGGSGGSYDPSYYYSSQSRPFRYVIGATGTPTGYGASNLPPGLSLNPFTGEITGVPATAGTFTVPLSATNAAGTGTATLTINATTAAPVIKNGLTAVGAVGSYLYFSVNTDQQTSSYYYSSSSNYEPVVYRAVGLPPGLSLNTVSGQVSGTPSQTGTFPVTLFATNRSGVGRAVVTFAIGAATPPVPSTLPPTLSGNAVARGFVGVPFTYSFYSSGTLAVSGLPAGLSLDPATRQIIGTPAVAGDFPVAVSSTNAAGTSNATLTVSIPASPGELLISNAAGTRVTVGSSFYYYITTAYDTTKPTPTSYGASNLPAGLTLNAVTGAISGTPTGAPGNFTVPLTVTAGGVTAGATLTLTLLPATSAPPATTPSAPALGRPTGALAFTLNPFVYALGGGGWTPDAALPTGLNFDPATGFLTGYPTQAGTYPIAVTAPNPVSGGPAGHAVVVLRVAAPDLSLPRIITSPANQVTTQGQGATFSASALGAPAPSFAWLHDGVSVPNAVDATLTLANVQPPDAGAYVFTATNAAGSTQSPAATLTVRVTYNTWQASHFTTAEIAGGLAADGFDFNGDGVSNLLEYALGRDPRANLDLRGLPVVSRNPAGDRLQLQFFRDPSKTDVDYLVEASADLQTWTAIARSTAGGATLNLGGANDVTEEAAGTVRSVVVQDGLPFGNGLRHFLRLRVTRP